MQEAPKRELTLFDSTCLIVGIIIGAGVYKMAPDIAKGVGSWWGVFAIWSVGGLLSLFGALGYAELATAYPEEGGDYVYLTRAYGRWAGFLFGWVQFVVVRPGDIAVMVFAFATYFRAACFPQASADDEWIYAAGAVFVLTGINAVGVRAGKWTQNILTMVKALGLLAIVGVAAVAPAPAAQPIEPFAWTPPLSLALIFVLFAFGGWNEMAYVAAEVKNPRRNIVRALVIGTLAVTLLYLLLNGAFLYTLGYMGMATSDVVATDAVSTVFPEHGSWLISVLICISALGAANGLIFAGARISYAVGKEHRALAPLGKWNPRTGTPARAILVQGVIATILVAALGSFIDALLFTAAAVYSFYLATSVAVIVLRFREPNVERPYRVTGYPFTTLIFCAVCVLLIYSSVTYAAGVYSEDPYKWSIAMVAIGLLLLGLPLYWLTTPRAAKAEPPVS